MTETGQKRILALDLGKIAALGERAAGVVVDAEVHRKMRRQLGRRESASLDRNAGDAREIRRERRRERLIARRLRFGERAREIGRRHEIAA